MVETRSALFQTERTIPTATELDTSSWGTVLVVVAHPDDAEMAMAGTIAKLTAEGKKVILIVATNGEKGINNNNRNLSNNLGQIRKREQLAAAEKLGIFGLIFLNFPDQGLTSEIEIVTEKLADIFEKYNPDAVFTWDCLSPHFKLNGQQHPDHTAIDFATFEALRTAELDHEPDLFLFLPQPHQISHYVVLNGLLNTKIEALNEHLSQMDPSMLKGPARLALKNLTTIGHFAESFRNLEY